MGEARERGYLLTSFPVCFQVEVVLESGHILTGEQRAPSENCGGVSDSCPQVNVEGSPAPSKHTHLMYADSVHRHDNVGC